MALNIFRTYKIQAKGLGFNDPAPRNSNVDNNYKDMPKICQRVNTSYVG